MRMEVFIMGIRLRKAQDTRRKTMLKYILALIPLFIGVIQGAMEIIAYYNHPESSASIGTYLLIPAFLVLVSIISLFIVAENKKLRHLLSLLPLISGFGLFIWCILNNIIYPTNNQSYETYILVIGVLIITGLIMCYFEKRRY